MILDKTKFYGLKYDPVFKNVFYKDTTLLKRFLTDILSNFYDDIYIDNVKILNAELTKDRLYIKNKVVDILVVIKDKIINCEVNMTYDKETEFRNFFYLIQSVGLSVKKAKNYIQVRDHIQININFMKDKALGFEISEYTNITTKKVKIPFIITIDVNVDYFKDKWYNLNKDKQYFDKFKSIIMFSLSESEFKNLEDDDLYMKKIKDDVEKLNSNSEFYQWMSDEEDKIMMQNSIKIRYKQEGKEEGVKEGVKKGTIKAKSQIVKKMKKLNYKVEDIINITGLTEEEILT